MTKMADFYRDSEALYYKYKEKHADDDWEQEYFDAMDVRYSTEEECLIHFYYWDDDNISETLQGIFKAIDGKRVILSHVFDDDYNQTTIVTAIVDKQKGA